MTAETQQEEWLCLRNLMQSYDCLPQPVDDEFEEAIYNYDRNVRRFLEAAQANGRTWPNASSR